MKLIFLLAFLCGVTQCFAQRQNVYFLKNDGRYVDQRDSADFVRVIREPDSGSVYFNVLEFYREGQRKFVGKSSKIEPVELEDQGIDFFKNGKKSVVATYKDNKFTGVVYNYFPSGKLYNAIEYTPKLAESNSNEVSGDSYDSVLITDCRDSTGKILVEKGNGHFVGYHKDFSYIDEEGSVTNGKKDGLWQGKDLGVKITFVETYKDGKFISGESTDSAGVKRSYTKRMVSPQFTGGVNALYAYLGTHIIYPDYARAHDIQGLVLLSFVVKKDGSLKDIKVIKSVHELLDNEAVRVLKRSKTWQSGMYYGLPVNVQYTLPVSFSLKN